MKILPIIVCGLSLTLSACSLVPEEISTADENLLISYQDAKKSPELYQSMPARWGGIIADITNTPKNTVIEVVNVELNSAAKPKSVNKSDGRFRVIHPGLLDPMIYKKGKYITAVGDIGVTQSGKIGELDYQFPVLQASGIYIWKEVKNINLRVKHDPFMSPYYSPYYHYPYPVSSKTVIIKKTGKSSK